MDLESIALALLGLLVGIWIGPRVADKIIQAGKSLERMSATDKIAVGIGTALGVIVTLFFFQLLSQIPIPLPVRIGIFILLSVILIYLGIVAMMSMKTGRMKPSSTRLWPREPDAARGR